MNKKLNGSNICLVCYEHPLPPTEDIRYWNTERKEVYCSAQCMMNRHEELRKQNAYKS